MLLMGVATGTGTPFVRLRLGLPKSHVGKINAGRERNVSRRTVDVVTLNAFIHDRVSTADHRFAVAG